MSLAPDRLAIGLTRHFTTAGVHPYDMVAWERRDARISNWKDGSVAFEQLGVELPASWSLNATNIVAQKYFRGTLGTAERESSLRQVIDRVVDTITLWGIEGGYFADQDEVDAFNAELIVVHVVEPDDVADVAAGAERLRAWAGPDIRGVYAYRELVLRVGSVPEILTDKNGVMAEPGNPASIAAALRKSDSGGVVDDTERDDAREENVEEDHHVHILSERIAEIGNRGLFRADAGDRRRRFDAPVELVRRPMVRAKGGTGHSRTLLQEAL